MAVILNHHDFDLKGKTGGTTKIICPFCSYTRTKNKRERCLYVNLNDRTYHCFNCEAKGLLDKRTSEKKEWKEPEIKWHNLSATSLAYLKSRGISERVIIRNKLVETIRPQDNDWKDKESYTAFISAPYFDHTHIKPKNYKHRCIKVKAYQQEANAIPLMYNIHEWAKSEELIIVEGEMDVWSINECEIWNVSTLPSGAINENDTQIDGKLQGLYNSSEYLENKKKIILFTDRDVQGQRLAFEIASKVGTHRVFVVETPEGYKDANEILNGSKEKNLPALGKDKLKEVIANAKQLPVSGAHYAGGIMEVMVYNFQHGKPKGHTTHFYDIDRLMKWKFGGLYLFTGYMNSGKSFTVLQMMLVMSMYNGWKWAVYSPENYPPEDFYDDLIEMFVGKHIDDRANNRMSEGEYREAIEFIDEHIIFVYPDNDDVQTLNSIHVTFAALVLKHGVKGVCIDPFNQLDKDVTEESQMYDMYIGSSLKKQKRFAVEYNLIYIDVAHPRNVPPDKDGKLPIVEIHHVAGGAMWGNRVDDAVSIYAANWSMDKNDTYRQFHKLKTKRKRTGGENGMCDFNVNTMSMRIIENGGRVPCCMNRANNYKDIQADRELHPEKYANEIPFPKPPVKPDKFSIAKQESEQQSSLFDEPNDVEDTPF